MSKPMISLDPLLVDNLIKEHLYAAVVATLGEKKDALLRSLCDTVLNLKCNQNGEISSYSSENKYTWIEMTLNRELRGIIKQAVIDQLNAMKPEIDKAVKAEVRKSGSAIAKAMMDGVVNSLKYDWNFKLNIGGKE